MSETRLIRYRQEDNGTYTPVAKTKSDIAQDALPVEPGSIVYVLCSDAQVGIEKALVCFAKSSVPFLGDGGNVVASSKSASVFRVDTLVCDIALLEKIVAETCVPATIQRIIVVDSKSEYLFPADVANRYTCTYQYEAR